LTKSYGPDTLICRNGYTSITNYATILLPWTRHVNLQEWTHKHYKLCHYIVTMDQTR